MALPENTKPMKVLVRETGPGDVDSLNRLYRRLAGIERSAGQYRWEWQEGPYGPAPSWVILDQDTGTIVGHHGVVPVPLWTGRGRLLAARTENTMLAPEARGRFAYHRVEAKLLAQLLERYEVILTTAGKGPQAAVRRRLGYEAEGAWVNFLLPAGPLYLARRVAGRLMPARAGAGTGMLIPCADGERLAGLWRECRGAESSLAPEREAPYLNWRVFAHPYHRHGTALLSEGGRDRAALIWREMPGVGGTLELVVEDLFGLSASDRVAALAAFASAQRLHAARVGLRVLAGSALAQEAMQAGGKPNASGGAELLVRYRDLATRRVWNATGLLGQGI